MIGSERGIRFGGTFGAAAANLGGMTCATKSVSAAIPSKMVSEVLQELAKDELILELIIEPKDVERWNRLVQKHHYLKEHRMVGESLRYVAKLDGKWVALLGWSSAAFHLGARDAWIGWTEPLRKSRRSLVACNARFVLLGPKSKSGNLASRILSLNLKRLSEDWQRVYNHPIALVETFVDPELFEALVTARPIGLKSESPKASAALASTSINSTISPRLSITCRYFERTSAWLSVGMTFSISADTTCARL